MKEALYYVLLVLAVRRLKTASSGHSQISQIDHLPPNLVPLIHDLKVYTEFENENDLFQGDVRIPAALNKVCQNRTTIIIAHRLSTLIHADEILVLRDGEICERGRHQQLVNSGGLYATMWQQQLENDQSSNGPPLSTQEAIEKL